MFKALLLFMVPCLAQNTSAEKESSETFKTTVQFSKLIYLILELFPLFSIVQFQNLRKFKYMKAKTKSQSNSLSAIYIPFCILECTSASSPTTFGVCLTTAECQQNSGTAQGGCAAGIFSNSQCSAIQG